MSALSRRSLVTSAAALPALAVPAVAVAACAEPDPIYAAIEACLEAERRAYAEAWPRFEKAQRRFSEKYGREEPDAFSKEAREGFAKEGLRSFPGAHAVATRQSIGSSMRCTEKEVKTWRKPARSSMENLTGRRRHTKRPSSRARKHSTQPMNASIGCSKR
jgi:hypothetical protein